MFCNVVSHKESQVGCVRSPTSHRPCLFGIALVPLSSYLAQVLMLSDIFFTQFEVPSVGTQCDGRVATLKNTNNCMLKTHIHGKDFRVLNC